MGSFHMVQYLLSWYPELTGPYLMEFSEET